MQIRSEQLFTTIRPQTRAGKVLQFPLSRILIAIAFLIPVVVFHNVILELVLDRFEKPLYSYLLNIETIIIFAGLLLMYRLYVKVVERRRSVEISARFCLKEIDTGILIGGGIIVIMTALLSLLGYYQIAEIGHWSVLVNAVFLFAIGAFLQELVFRIVVFRLVEELLGSWLALVAISLIFGIAHIGNPNVSLWSTIALILQDVLLTAAFIYTRRIWFVWGMHGAWNFFQDGIFGMPNSGVTSFVSWITPRVVGPAWLTGGSFGLEASLVTTVLCLILGIIILITAINRGQLVKPIWLRNRR
jgi:membrane protease YdiL (CAAX protease family)